MKNEFEVIDPFLPELRAYIENHLRLLRARDIAEGLINTSDVVDDVIIKVHEEFDKRPKNIELKQWLYDITDKILKKYEKEVKNEKSEKSYEYLKDKELKRLEEVDKLNAEAEGRKLLREDFDPEDNLLYDDDA